MTTKYYAGIGSRDLTPEQLETCERLGFWFARCGWTLHTGNAPGADQAFAQGANQVNPALVHLHLPWPGFERQAVVNGNVVRSLEDLEPARLAWYTALAKKHHGAWHKLTQGGEKLMIRNGLIMLPCGCHPVDLCLALPSAKRWGGGTGQGMRLGEKLKIRVVNLRELDRQQLAALCDEVE